MRNDPILSESEVLFRLNDLNQQMMRLSAEERRKQWRYYYDRLGELAIRSSGVNSENGEGGSAQVESSSVASAGSPQVRVLPK